jgi:undecaprenyl pyrophosphate phosphatase UppP
MSMDNSQILLLVTTVLFWYATGASWLLQYVAYPTYKLVNKDGFVPFHVEFGKRLLISTVMPMVIGNLCSFILVFYHPDSSPVGLVYLVAICSVVILFTTMKYEVPRHNKLDEIGKDDALIDGLVQDNAPRTASWTIASLALAYMILKAL